MTTRTMTLDSLFDSDDLSNATSRIASASMGGGRHSIGVAGPMASHDPALRTISIEMDAFEHVMARPRGLSRFHSLPTALYSETDDMDSPPASAKSDGSADVKRKSLLEMIDADHPASPSKDADEASPTTLPASPKRRRSLGLSTSPISRPSMIEKETARLAASAYEAALAAGEAEEADYGSEADTESGEMIESPTAPSLSPTATVAADAVKKSYAPRQSLIQLTQLNFEQQMRDEAAQQQAVYEAQQQQAVYEAQQQQAVYEAQQQQAAAAHELAQQQQQLFAMQQQQQQQLFAVQQPQQLPFNFATPMPAAFLSGPMQPMQPMQQMQQMQPMQQMLMPAPPMVQYQLSPVYSSQPAAPPPPPASPPLSEAPNSPQHNPQYQQSRHAASPPRGHASALKLGQTTHLLDLAMDKKGSRQLQDGLPKMSDAQLARACDELGPHLLMLAKHPAANYVVSRLVSLPQGHAHVMGALSGHVAELLVHPQGSRVVQAAIAELPLAASEQLVGELASRVVGCALDTHGSWGVCAAYKRSHADFILADVISSIETLSLQQHGCRVVQRVLAEAAAAGAGIGGATARLLASGNIGKHASDPYGNYAVQVTLRHSAAAERQQLVSALLPSLLSLSTSKHGSNVAEALLTMANPQQLQHARRLFLGRNTLRELTSHPFGNYVLQAMMRLLSPEDRAVTVRAIELDAADTTYGRTIVTHFAAKH